MSLATQIISGSTQALNILKDFLSNPAICLPMVGITDVPTIDPGSEVPIQGSEYHEIGVDEISSQLIVDSSGGKNYVTDNIAPRPRTWEVKGFIGSSVAENLSSAVLQNVLQQRLIKLRAYRTSRIPLVFRTKNGEELVFVGIKNMQIDSDPAIQNRIPISMTIQEIPILTENQSGQLGIPSSSNPAGDPAPQGLTSALVAVNVAGISAVLAGV